MNSTDRLRFQLHPLATGRALVIAFAFFILLKALGMEDMQQHTFHYRIIILKRFKADGAFLDNICFCPSLLEL